jgi:hypothetical protein
MKKKRFFILWIGKARIVVGQTLFKMLAEIQLVMPKKCQEIMWKGAQKETWEETFNLGVVFRTFCYTSCPESIYISYGSSTSNKLSTHSMGAYSHYMVDVPTTSSRVCDLRITRITLISKVVLPFKWVFLLTVANK